MWSGTRRRGHTPLTVHNLDTYIVVQFHNLSMPLIKRYITTNDGQSLPASDGSYVVMEAEIDPADLTLATPRTPMFKPGTNRLTRCGTTSTPGFTGPYHS